jgi:K+-transporting ATPase ATPase C chain
MLQTTLQGLRMLIVMTVITGALYPLVVTAFAQTFFPDRANGSLIFQDGKLRGSILIGQPFSAPKYFWSRPSATSPMPYNGGSSSGSNQGPTNPALAEAVVARVKALRESGDEALIMQTALVPVDLVTASGSGLDPHISPAAAEYQVARVAKVRGLAESKVREWVARHTEGRQFGMLGEPRVNVLALNLALDESFP